MSSNTFTLGTKSVNRLGYGAMQLAGPGGFGPPRDRHVAITGLREALAATWLAGNGDDYADTPVRFDEVAMMVVKENRALLRHHVNCFGEMEPLS